MPTATYITDELDFLPASPTCFILMSKCKQVSRGLLPDVGSEYEGAGGNITDAVDFLMVNFTEMNKLWVRMQHQGSGRDRYNTVQHLGTANHTVIVSR